MIGQLRCRFFDMISCSSSIQIASCHYYFWNSNSRGLARLSPPLETHSRNHSPTTFDFVNTLPYHLNKLPLLCFPPTRPPLGNLFPALRPKCIWNSKIHFFRQLASLSSEFSHHFCSHPTHPFRRIRFPPTKPPFLSSARVV